MDTFTLWNSETVPSFPPNYRVVWYWDPDYNPEDSWALDTEEETAAVAAEERAKLDSGSLVALGYSLERTCPTCGGWEHLDSLWGIVIEPDPHELSTFFRDQVSFSEVRHLDPIEVEQLCAAIAAL